MSPIRIRLVADPRPALVHQEALGILSRGGGDVGDWDVLVALMRLLVSPDWRLESISIPDDRVPPESWGPVVFYREGEGRDLSLRAVACAVDQRMEVRP